MLFIFKSRYKNSVKISGSLKQWDSLYYLFFSLEIQYSSYWRAIVVPVGWGSLKVLGLSLSFLFNRWRIKFLVLGGLKNIHVLLVDEVFKSQDARRCLLASTQVPSLCTRQQICNLLSLGVSLAISPIVIFFLHFLSSFSFTLGPLDCRRHTYSLEITSLF